MNVRDRRYLGHAHAPPHGHNRRLTASGPQINPTINPKEDA
jgi:hypothetical protein